MKNRHALLIVSAISFALFMGAAATGWAEEADAAGGPQGGSPYDFDIGLRLFGADVGVGYNGLAFLPSAQTTIWAYVGGGYETLHYYRDASGSFLSPGDLAAGGILAGSSPDQWRWEGAWRLGLEQGFIWNARTHTNLLEAFAYYRGRYNTNQIAAGQLLYDSNLVDRAGSLLNTLQAGVGYDDLLYDKKHKTKSGILTEATVEWGPGFLLNSLIGGSDFIRFNGTFRGFLPVYDLAPDTPSNLLSIYVGEFFEVDYIIGDQVPLYIRQSFGGRDYKGGLGGAVRGVDSAAYDANFKVVNCIDVRVNLPAIYWPDLVPGLVVFFDAGYYSQVGEPAVTAPGSGFICSVGGGPSINLFDLASLVLYFDYRLDKTNADGDPWSLASIGFGLHF